MEITNFLELINTYGVVPILLFGIWRLYIMLKSEKKVSEERLDHMLGDDVEDKVERTKLIENNLAILEKYVEKNVDLTDHIKELINEVKELRKEIQNLKNER